MITFALDIGGANIKAASSDGTAISMPFELWKDPAGLEDRLRVILAAQTHADRVAVTMTGELCDCFSTRKQGVLKILEAVERATPSALRDSLAVWCLEGTLLGLDEARAHAEIVGAANWLALATWAAREIGDSPGVLVDIGSTTTDIVALDGQAPRCIGRTDTERLLSGELVYSGVGRTPVAAVIDEVPYRGRACPVASELFATTLDVYLVLSLAVESPNDTGTADGREATGERATDRLGRMICADRETFAPSDALAVARAVASAQRKQVVRAMDKVLSASAIRPCVAVVAGAGEFLARSVVEEVCGDVQVVSLSRTMGSAASIAAPAFALARIVAALTDRDQVVGNVSWD